MNNFSCIFPGQGSQKVGMGFDFSQTEEYKKYFSLANEQLGFDLQKICEEGPLEKLTLSENAQPAILTVSTIIFRNFCRHIPININSAAGHSLGEFTALSIAGVIKFTDVVKIVHWRGKFMQETVPENVGAMAAILGKTEDEVIEICEKNSTSEHKVNAANINCPGQIVISGHKIAVEKVITQCKGKLLNVSAPFHSPLMFPVREKLSKIFKNISFQNSLFPIVNNVASQELMQKDFFSESLIKQVDHPVLWNKSICSMYEKYKTSFIEFGGDKVLTNMMKRINKGIECYSINIPEDIEKFKEKCFND